MSEDTSLVVRSVALPGTFTRIGWIPPDDLDYETWDGIGAGLAELEKAQHFWIGDWVNAGEQRWGETYAQSMDETRFAYSTISTDAWVCRNVPLCRRRPELSFGAHAVVAPERFSASDQTLLLASCLEYDWSIARLTIEANELRPPEKKSEVSFEIQCPHCARWFDPRKES